MCLEWNRENFHLIFRKFKKNIFQHFFLHFLMFFAFFSKLKEIKIQKSSKTQNNHCKSWLAKISASFQHFNRFYLKNNFSPFYNIKKKMLLIRFSQKMRKWSFFMRNSRKFLKNEIFEIFYKNSKISWEIKKVFAILPDTQNWFWQSLFNFSIPKIMLKINQTASKNRLRLRKKAWIFRIMQKFRHLKDNKKLHFTHFLYKI